MPNRSRRELIKFSIGAIATLAVDPSLANATPKEVDAAIGDWNFKGINAGVGNIRLIMPETVENGDRVRIEVNAPGALEIRIFADENQDPNVLAWKFGPASGDQSVRTLIRLQGTQNVVAVAEYPDGSFERATTRVKVETSGCRS